MTRAHVESSPCSCCGRAVHWLERFPHDRCLDCHAADPIVRRETAAMTATDLARLWGAQDPRD